MMEHSDHNTHSLDELVDEAFSGDLSWIHDQLDGTSSLDDALQDLAERKMETKQAIERLLLGVIGENDREFDTPQPDLPAMSRNRLREKQRTTLKGVLYGEEG